MIQRERVKALNAKPVARGAYVLYWMQASVRSEYNHALEYAILEANELRQPVVVYFGLTDALSFIVMSERDIREVLTFDAHFAQIGFRMIP